MKVAIKGHLTRGKEVIQILESLGGKNDCLLRGNDESSYYYIDTNYNKGIRCHDIDYANSCTKYTLEAFEQKFPFKIGDKVTILTDIPYKIVALEYYMGKLSYKLDNGLNYNPKVLTPYKEIKEERNTTLTLDKAKEWYNKGGELKEIALQAFSEKELNPFPRSWEEFCRNNPIKTSGAIICSESTIVACDYPGTRDSDCNREICPSKKSAEAHLAMIRLEQLRNCWWNSWEPEYNYGTKYIIKWDKDDLIVAASGRIRAFLIFPTREMAEEFLKCFRDLIEKAGDLI